MTEKQIADEHFATWTRHFRAFKRYKSLSSPKRRWEMAVLTLIGSTGVGKSRWAAEQFPNGYYLPFSKQSGTYWDGYEGQPVVIIEEISGARFSYTALLGLLDRYPMQVSVHGGFSEFSSHVIIFTSNTQPSEWYNPNNHPYENSPLKRRMTQGLSRIMSVTHLMQLEVTEGAALNDGWLEEIHATYTAFPPPENDEENNNNEDIEVVI